MSDISCLIFMMATVYFLPKSQLLAHVSQDKLKTQKGIISKAKNGLIKVQKAREIHSLPLKQNHNSRTYRSHYEAEKKKLINLVYHNGDYYISEPNGDKYVPRDPDLIIEKHCWEIVKFLDGKKAKLLVNDVIRFGRVSFKVTELAITQQEISQARQILDWTKNYTDFQIQGDSLQQDARRESEFKDYLQAELNLGPDRSGNASRLTIAGDVSLIRDRSNFSLNEQMLGNSSNNHSNLQRIQNLNQAAESTLFAMTNLNQSGSGLNLLQSNLNNSLQHSVSLDRQALIKNQSKEILQPIEFSLGRQNLSLSQNGLRGQIDERPQTQDSGVRACRICLEEEENFNDGNPFITPCKCTGSMGYIHLKCLRDWTDSKKQAQQEEGVASYYWENLQCELCKSPLNLVVQSVSRPGFQQFLLEIDRPQNDPYMILESDIECPSKAIHVINLRIKPICTVGRRCNNEISISDISVSRKQAEFQLVGKDLFVHDHDSKFGTFKKLHSLVHIDKKQYCLPIQIEKKCFFFKQMERFSTSQKCKFWCMRSYPREAYDHFRNMYDKFPQHIQKQLLPPDFFIKKGAISKVQTFRNNRVHNDDSQIQDYVSRQSQNESVQDGNLFALDQANQNQSSAKALNNLSQERLENNERVSIQERRQELPLQKIDEASDNSQAHQENDIDSRIPEDDSKKSKIDDQSASFESKQSPNYLNPLDLQDNLPQSQIEASYEELKNSQETIKASPNKIVKNFHSQLISQDALGFQDSNFKHNPVYKDEQNHQKFQSRFKEDNQRNDDSNSARIGQMNTQINTNRLAGSVKTILEVDSIINTQVNRSLDLEEDKNIQDEPSFNHKGFEKIMKLQEQRLIQHESIDELRPLARSLLVVADFTQGREVDNLFKTKKNIIKRALESAELERAELKTVLANQNRSETLLLHASDISQENQQSIVDLTDLKDVKPDDFLLKK